MHSQEQFFNTKSFVQLPSVFKCQPWPCAVFHCPTNTGASTEQPLDPTGAIGIVFILHTAPYPPGRVTALILKNTPPKGTQWPSQALVIYYCKQMKRVSQRMHSPSLESPLVQHSTPLCLGQSFSEFQSGFASKSTLPYQHQVHSSGLACCTTPYTAKATSGSNQFLQNPAK